MSDAGSKVVGLEPQGQVAIITIRRPEARNAVNRDVAVGIESAIDALESNDEFRVGILTGLPPVFSSGADLKEIQAGNAAGLSTARGGFAGLVERERVKPLIAALDGPALAGGFEMVLACDLVVASRNSHFSLPEVKRSLMAAAGGLFRIGQKLPLNVAMECALTGEAITSERAYQLGLVNQLTSEGGAVAGALDLASRIVRNAPVAVRESRRLVADTWRLADEDGFRESIQGLDRVMKSPDVDEGLRAFIEKRPPRWIDH